MSIKWLQDNLYDPLIQQDLRSPWHQIRFHRIQSQQVRDSVSRFHHGCLSLAFPPLMTHWQFQYLTLLLILQYWQQSQLEENLLLLQILKLKTQPPFLCKTSIFNHLMLLLMTGVQPTRPFLEFKHLHFNMMFLVAIWDGETVLFRSHSILCNSILLVHVQTQDTYGCTRL